MTDTFCKRLGTTDKGKDYEDLTVANLALQLVTNKNVKDFKISSNDENFGAFDDVVIEIEVEDQPEHKFALQLKHVSRGRKLPLKALTEDNGNYSIKKYFKSFQQIKKSAKGHKLILITNLDFEVENNTQIALHEDETLQVHIFKDENHSLLFNDKYSFKIVGNAKSKKLEDYKNFFDCFYLCANQPNVDEIKQSTVNTLKNKFCCDESVADAYFRFVSEWSIREGTKEKLDKKIIEKVLALKVLARLIHPICFGQVNDNIKLLQEAMLNFNVTIFGISELEIVKTLWGDTKGEMKDAKELNILRKKYQIKMTNINEINSLTDEECSIFLWLLDKCPLIVTNYPSIFEIMRLCRDKQFIVVGNDFEDQQWKEFTVFQKLSDLLNFPSLLHKLTMSFKCYVQERYEVDLKELIENDITIQDAISTNELIRMVSSPFVIGSTKEVLPVPCISRFFAVPKCDDAGKIQYYRMKESNLFGTKLNRINIISGEAGIGKTTLVKSLNFNSSLKLWIITFSSFDTTTLCFHLKNSSNFLEFILNVKYPNFNNFEKEFVKMMVKKGQVIYIWDSINEISKEDLDIIFDLISVLSDGTFMQWITCRSYFKVFVEAKFGINSIKLLPFTKDQQLLYLRGKFGDGGDVNTCEKILKSLSSVGSVLGNPTYLSLLTKMFLQDSQKYNDLLDGIFPEIYLFDYFLEEKCNVFYRDKANINFSNRALSNVLELEKKTRIENYEKAALICTIDLTCFPWPIKCDEFFMEIDTSGDKFGFIDVKNKRPIFIHKSFAEYFVALFLYKNMDNIKKLKHIIVDPKNTRVRYYFDLFLATNSATHIAVLHKRLDALKKYGNQLDRYWEGRNALQLACSWGVRYPKIKITKRSDLHLVDEANFPHNSLEAEGEDYVQILELLLEQCDFYEKDVFFGLDALAIARKFNCLSAVTVLRRHQKKITSVFYNVCSSLFRTSFDRLVSTVLYFSVTIEDGSYLNFFEDQDIHFIVRKSDERSLIHFLVTKNNIACVQRLLGLKQYQENIDWCDRLGETPMFLACSLGHEDIVDLLCKYGANVNISNSQSKTPLHVASENGHYNVVVNLISCGAEIEVTDEDNATPLMCALKNNHSNIVEFLSTFN